MSQDKFNRGRSLEAQSDNRSTGDQTDHDRAMAALDARLQRKASEKKLTQGQLVEKYRVFLLKGVRDGNSIKDLMVILKEDLGETIKPDGFRSALRKKLGTVKAIRAQKDAQPEPAYSPRPISSFVHRAHRGEI